MAAAYLSIQQALNVDPKVIQQIDFTGNLEKAGNTTVVFILEGVKETILNFPQGTVRVL